MELGYNLHGTDNACLVVPGLVYMAEAALAHDADFFKLAFTDVCFWSRHAEVRRVEA